MQLLSYGWGTPAACIAGGDFCIGARRRACVHHARAYRHSLKERIACSTAWRPAFSGAWGCMDASRRSVFAQKTLRREASPCWRLCHGVLRQVAGLPGPGGGHIRCAAGLPASALRHRPASRPHAAA